MIKKYKSQILILGLVIIFIDLLVLRRHVEASPKYYTSAAGGYAIAEVLVGLFIVYFGFIKPTR